MFFWNGKMPVFEQISGVLGAKPLGEGVAPEQVRGRLQTRLGRDIKDAASSAA